MFSSAEWHADWRTSWEENSNVFITSDALVAKSCLTLATPWTVARQATGKSMGFPRQEYRSGLPFPPLEDLPNPGIKPWSPALAGGFFYQWYHLGSSQIPVLNKKIVAIIIFSGNYESLVLHFCRNRNNLEMLNRIED